MIPEQDHQGLPRFVFVMLEVTYKEVSDLAFQRGMTVQEFVSRAIQEYADQGKASKQKEKSR